MYVYIYIYIYICIYLYLYTHRAQVTYTSVARVHRIAAGGSITGEARMRARIVSGVSCVEYASIREFKDVVFEDVVFDHSRFDIDVTI